MIIGRLLKCFYHKKELIKIERNNYLISHHNIMLYLIVELGWIELLTVFENLRKRNNEYFLTTDNSHPSHDNIVNHALRIKCEQNRVNETEDLLYKTWFDIDIHIQNLR